MMAQTSSYHSLRCTVKACSEVPLIQLMITKGSKMHNYSNSSPQKHSST